MYIVVFFVAMLVEEVMVEGVKVMVVLVAVVVVFFPYLCLWG